MKKLSYLTKEDIQKLNTEETILYISDAIKENNTEIITKLYEHLGKNIYMMHPKIDTREKCKVMVELLKNYGFYLAKIDYNDYCIDRIMGIEHKSNDLLPSLFEGKLWQQLEEAKQNYKFTYLIIDHPYSYYKEELMKKGSSINVLRGFVTSACARGFPPVFLDDPNEMSKIIHMLTLKCWDNKDREVILLQRQHEKDNDELNILCRFPRMQINHAETLLKINGCLGKVFEFIYLLPMIDDETRIELLPGIGEDAINKWIWTLEKEY